MLPFIFSTRHGAPSDPHARGTVGDCHDESGDTGARDGLQPVSAPYEISLPERKYEFYHTPVLCADNPQRNVSI